MPEKRTADGKDLTITKGIAPITPTVKPTNAYHGSRTDTSSAIC